MAMKKASSEPPEARSPGMDLKREQVMRTVAVPARMVLHGVARDAFRQERHPCDAEAVKVVCGGVVQAAYRLVDVLGEFRGYELRGNGREGVVVGLADCKEM